MSMLRRRLTAAALGVGGALLLPAAGHAATTFGSRLNHDPTDSGCGMLGACTLVSYINPIDPNGDPYSGGAPSDGVITRFRIRAYATGAPAPVTFRVADVSLPDPSNRDSAVAGNAGTGPTATIPVDDDGADVPVTEVAGRVPVRQGQHLAIDNTTVSAIYASSGSKFTYVFAPPLVDGQGPRGSSAVTEELLVAATIEPDADRDGFGDETQDGCPSQAATHGACGQGTTSPPGTLTLRALRVRSGRISYTLSTGATVKLQLAKSVGGRKLNGRCVRPTRANRQRPHCQRFVALGRAFAGPGAKGANDRALPKRHGHRLGAGSYRLTATARDAAGKRVTATTRFTIVPVRRVATR